MVIVTATVPKKLNCIWAGRGRVFSLDLQSGIAIVAMETGKMKGKSGGFPLDLLRFKTTKSETVEEASQRIDRSRHTPNDPYGNEAQ